MTLAEDFRARLKEVASRHDTLFVKKLAGKPETSAARQEAIADLELPLEISDFPLAFNQEDQHRVGEPGPGRGAMRRAIAAASAPIVGPNNGRSSAAQDAIDEARQAWCNSGDAWSCGVCDPNRPGHCPRSPKSIRSDVLGAARRTMRSSPRHGRW